MSEEKDVTLEPEANVRDKEGKKVIVVLEKAALETVKTKKGYELINADTHNGILKRYNKDPKAYRPDILHQVCDICSIG